MRAPVKTYQENKVTGVKPDMLKNQTRYSYDAKPRLGIGAAILQISGFKNSTDAELEKVKLREYIEECSKIGFAAWFCSRELLDRISIRHEIHDNAANGYFLVIEKLDMPTLYNLCGFMWNHNGFPCKQFNELNPEY